MNPISPLKAGATVGTLFGGAHLCWAALVAVSLAQPFVDFILRLHLIEPFIRVQPFNLGAATLLVAITAAIGFATGALAAVTWNQLFEPAAKPSRATLHSIN